MIYCLCSYCKHIDGFKRTVFSNICDLNYDVNAFAVTDWARSLLPDILSSAIVYNNVALLRLSKRQGHFPAGRP